MISDEVLGQKRGILGSPSDTIHLGDLTALVAGCRDFLQCRALEAAVVTEIRNHLEQRKSWAARRKL
jgi:hypothetical protein